MATEKRLIEYYVVRNKSTGFYFRGKGVNRWGEYYNQASIYRVRAHAENTANWLNLRGEPVEIVPIEIKENPTVDAVEVVHGQWEEWWPGITLIMTGEEMLYRCSVCDAKYPDIEGYRYCPRCGADMRGDGNG